MSTIQGPAKDTVTDLKIAGEGARRILVGLTWTPSELPKLDVGISAPPADRKDTTGKIVYFMMKPFEFLRAIVLAPFKLALMAGYAGNTTKRDDEKGRDLKATQYDLDLDCYIYDQNMQLKCVVGTEDDALLIDESRKVYHTGDDQSGMGGEGEQIFIETSGLPADYVNFFFVVRSDAKYNLAQYRNPIARVADSKTEEVELKNSLLPDNPQPPSYNYVFCHIFRDGARWRVRNLDVFQGDGVNWESFLPSLVEQKAA